MTKTPSKDEGRDATPQFDDVLKRMLSSPPKQHKDEKRPKPADKSANKKPPGQ